MKEIESKNAEKPRLEYTTVPLEKIKIVEGGFPRVKEWTSDLVESIKLVGLLNNLLLNSNLELLAGGRRYSALKQLGWKTVPVTIIYGDELAQRRAASDEGWTFQQLPKDEFYAALKMKGEVMKALGVKWPPY